MLSVRLTDAGDVILAEVESGFVWSPFEDLEVAYRATQRPGRWLFAESIEDAQAKVHAIPDPRFDAFPEWIRQLEMARKEREEQMQ
jgi:hypothetical protein